MFDNFFWRLTKHQYIGHTLGGSFGLQDAEMLEQMRVLRRLVERVEMLEGRVRDGVMGGDAPVDERPPHY